MVEGNGLTEAVARWRRVEALFNDALDLAPVDRAGFVTSASEGDEVLRLEVLRLLDATALEDDFIEPPLHSLAAQSGALENGVSANGRRIGRYRLISVIATGGMGTVYRAEQDHPKRTVALKLLRASGASPAMLRRFEHEAEALGRLRHPGVAQVFEAGAYEEHGVHVPYFALEYIAGAESIVAYADREGLDTEARLRLLAGVTDAVHHGHQRGIIHRDLKPGNILVDSSGQPKVIDFGVARLTDSDVAATTLRTDVGQLVGTLAYMSPEQCAADPNEIDTRSDVYALGVVLHELLSGRLPYEVRGKSIAEAARIIRDEAPSLPSDVEPKLRGDVDTIVLKALQKDPTRRYQSAAELGDDLRRYLANEPIQARRPSLAYQARLFARRNRGWVAAGALTLVILIASAIVSTTFGVRAMRAAEGEAEQRVRAERLVSFLQNIFTSASPANKGGEATVLDLISEASRRMESELSDQPAVAAGVRFTIGQTYNSLWMWGRGAAYLRAALEQYEQLYGPDHPDTIRCMVELAESLIYQGREEGLVLQERALREMQRLYPANHPLMVRNIHRLGLAYYRCRFPPDFVRAESLLTEAMRRYEAFGSDHVELAQCKNAYAAILATKGEYEQAEAYFEASLKTLNDRLGPEHPFTLECLIDYAYTLHNSGRFEEAGNVMSRCVDIKQRTFGAVWMAGILRNFARLQHARGDLEEAEESFRQSVVRQCDLNALERPEQARELKSIVRRLDGLDSSADRSNLWLVTLADLLAITGEAAVEDVRLLAMIGVLYEEMGRPEDAAPILKSAIVFAEGYYPEDHWVVADCRSALGGALVHEGRWEEAEPMLMDALRVLTMRLGENHWRTRAASRRVNDLLNRTGRSDKTTRIRAIH